MAIEKYKKIAKNTGMLYFRILITMLITLYTSRVILQTLGVTDFGIYNVVAGFVTMLGFLHSAMSTATQRFITFELGRKGNSDDVADIFNMSLNIHIIIAVIVFLFGETAGIWFINSQMNIPSSRLLAAEWVFHFSLFSFLITIISVPYNAMIIANERMGVFAWISIVNVILKLFVVMMLSWFGFDKLILYAVLSTAVSIIVFLIYKIYCYSSFPESKFKLYWNKKLFNIMLSYTGWNLWGNIAAVLSSQGVNILLNIFFGPAVNAARAIAMQVSGALNSFVQSLQLAVNPQIIKSYASEDRVFMETLIFYGAKYNYFLLLTLSMPVIVNTHIILEFWLGTVPKYTVIFVQLIIVNILVDSVSGPLITSAQATGKIKLYQTIVGGVLLMNVPLSYLFLKIGSSPDIVVYTSIALSVVALIARLLIVRNLISLSITTYFKEVIIRCLLVTFIVLVCYKYLAKFATGSFSFFLQSLLMTMVILITISIFGINKHERFYLINLVKSALSRN